ncbi:MAG: PucR family transcriptional regulator ligand-binding domain-containing protein [Lachnospiraceae bacterium]
MLDVASLMNSDIFHNFELVSGRDGIYRSISNVVILDYEGIEGDFSGFHEGDFVITNLMFAKNDPSKIYPAFETLIQNGISVFAIKTVFYTSLPEEVIALTEKYQIPLFFFHDVYVEDVLLSITDQLRSHANFSYYENLIHTLITTPSHSETINELLHSFLSCRFEKPIPLFVSVLYFEYNETPDEFMLQKNVNKLTMKLQHMNISNKPEIIKYKKGILIFSFFTAEECSGSRTAFWQNILVELALTNYRAGISDLPMEAGKLDIAIKRAIYAYRNATDNNVKLSLYSDLNVDHLLNVFCENDYVREYLAELSTRFQGSKNETYKNTIVALVHNHFDIEQAASELFQHPNTIRYRVSRLKETFHTDNEWEFQLLCALIVSI